MEVLIGQISEPLIAILVPIIVAGIHALVARLPKWSLPIIAGALGPVVDTTLALIPTVDAVGWEATLLGLAGVGVREVVDQITKAVKGA